MFHARGMHCHGCEHIIERAAQKLPGVRRIKADYPSETVTVEFDAASTTLEEIRSSIERCGYRTLLVKDAARPGTIRNILGLIFALVGLALIIFLDTVWIDQGGAPDISQHFDLGLIFLLGLLTGFHCIGMCGGFVLSYVADDARAGRRSYLSHLLYAGGKTLSYTALGALFGWLGAFIAFTPLLRGAAGIFAGAFLIIFGLNMLGLFAPLRRFRLGLPTPLQRIIQKEAYRRHRPFITGLLNGLMIACGPLQAMYVMAAGTGDAAEGAKMLLSFALGTLPVLMTFGVLTTYISGGLTHRLLKASGVIVVVLGAVMINRGLILTGFGYDLRSIMATIDRKLLSSGPTPEQIPSPSNPAQREPSAAPVRPEGEAKPEAPPAQVPPADQTIRMDVIRSGFSPNHFVLIKGVPVKWVIEGKEITTCNNRIVVPSLNLEFEVKKGSQTIEFTPKKAGTILWSCWMGMLRGEFEVVEPPTSGHAEQAGGAPPPPSHEQPVVADRAATATYVVKPGDTLEGIAARLYKDRRRWRDIANANPGRDINRLRPGETIRLPEQASSPEITR
jgi:uncharacterized protein